MASPEPAVPVVDGPRRTRHAPLEPSEEAQWIADVCADTMLAFERKFYGKISWTIDMPGMIAVDASAVRQEQVILDLMAAAVQERLRAGYLWEQHQYMRAEHLEDEERRKRDQPNYMDEMSKAVPDMIKRMNEAMKGEHRIDLNDPDARKKFEAEMRKITADLQADARAPPYEESLGPLESEPAGDAEPSTGDGDAGSPSGKSSVATDPPAGDDSA